MTESKTKHEYSFWKLINEFRIEIPILQRDYAQGRTAEKVKEVRQGFLNSLYEALVEKKTLDLDFVYGNLQAGELFIPLDGQQRLTTLFLLHWYLAVQEGKLKEYDVIFSRFTYETRASSREFCNALVHGHELWHGVQLKNLPSVSSIIENAAWYFISWGKDPTIQSMLVMLDAIHEKFKASGDLFNELIHGEPSPITFQFIKMENFGLDDSLYIKMNARGKTLTSYENFKAKFEQWVAQNEGDGNLESGFAKEFAKNVDGKWTDLFWPHRDKTTNLYDNQVMNFYRAMIINHYASNQKHSPAVLDKTLEELIQSKEHISFAKYKEFECIDSEVIAEIFITLDKLHNPQGDTVNTYLSDQTLINEQALFEAVIQNYGFTYTERIRFYALIQFIKQHRTQFDSRQLDDWMRVIRNLTEYTPYNQVREFVRSIRSISQMIDKSANILSYMAGVQNHEIGFYGEQVEEERIKAVLILKSDRWRRAILEAEAHGYFKGQIGFLLEFSNIYKEYREGNKSLNWTADLDDQYYKQFKVYFDKARAVFNEHGLAVNVNLWRRALLCKGDYLLKSNLNYSFVINFGRDLSWKRLLRENDKRKFVKSLLDDIDVQHIQESLQKVINQSSIQDWRKYFIECPYLIDKGCGTQKFIRWRSERDILLLNTTTTAGYCKEYYSYALYHKLLEQKMPGVQVEYIDTRGVDIYKYVKVKKNNRELEVMFNSDQNQYIVEEGNNLTVFAAFDDVLSYLKQ